VHFYFLYSTFPVQHLREAGGFISSLAESFRNETVLVRVMDESLIKETTRCTVRWYECSTHTQGWKGFRNSVH
jgi:hypothetical protein